MACLFCEIAAARVPASFVARTDSLAAFLDLHPVFPGHVLVVPRTHADDLFDVPAATLAELMAFARRVAKAQEVALGAEGAFVAVNHRVSQSVPHLHVHVVPRKKKDGLRGFFWPRTKYASDAERDAVAAKLAAALEDGRA